MQKSTHLLSKNRSPENSISASVLSRLLDSYLLACDIASHSDRTIQNRRERIRGLLWFLGKRGLETCGLDELRQFMHYLGHGHEEPGGRFGCARLTKASSPGTIKSYHSSLRTFFNWLVEEGELESSPMERIKPPIDRPDQIQPFSNDQLRKLLLAAKKTTHPRRNEAILLLLLDTGIRASEICSLRVCDLSLQEGSIRVEGKGGKKRSLHFDRETKKALYLYLAEEERHADQALFLSDRGRDAGEGLTRQGLLVAIRRMGKQAGIASVRCSPHTFRHTFAISFLRAGGNVFTLKELLGHTSLAMTNRYVSVAQADLSEAARRFSPVAHLKREKSGK